MIFYFTGTGNSKWIAGLFGQKLNEKIASINDLLRSDEDTYTFTVKPDERLGLIFPVYSWGIPYPITLFLRRLKLTMQNGIDSNEVKAFFVVATCGNYAGLTDRIIEKELQKNGFSLISCHTIQMPNVYIVLPGFDVDTDDIRDEKLAHAEARADLIVQRIIEGGQDNRLYEKGNFAWFKSKIIYPGFIKSTFRTKFHVTADKCSHCELCAKLCPMKNITIQDGLPQWDNHCVQCLACIHRCPQRAIEYGNATQKKGRYFFGMRPSK